MSCKLSVKQEAREEKFTSIGGIFKFELNLTKCLGGHLCEKNKLIAYSYLIFVTLLSKFLIFKFASARFKEIDTFSRAARQNIELYIKVCYLLWFFQQFAIAYTTIVYSNILFVITRKRMSVRYLQCGHRRKLDSCIWRVKIILAGIVIFATLTARSRNSETVELRTINQLEFDQFWTTNATTTNSLHSKLAGIPGLNWLADNNDRKLRWCLFSLNQLGQNLFYLTRETLQVNLVETQSYGHQLVAIMILAALHDMLLYSCKHDGIPLESLSQLNERQNRFTFSTAFGHHRNRKLSRVQRRSGGKKVVKHAPLLTTKLLIQIKQVLQLLQRAISFEYLVSYLFSISRIIYCISMLYGQVKVRLLEPNSFIVTFLLEYLRNLIAMFVLQLTYFWLHGSVSKLKRSMEDIQLLESCGEPILSELNRESISRLSNEILALFPTDWLMINMRNIFEHQLYILTLVVSSEQIVEATFLQIAA